MDTLYQEFIIISIKEHRYIGVNVTITSGSKKEISKKYIEQPFQVSESKKVICEKQNMLSFYVITNHC